MNCPSVVFLDWNGGFSPDECLAPSPASESWGRSANGPLVDSASSGGSRASGQ